jgi:23S rRNA (uracil1939-C5)-methyltransferase
VKAEPQTVEIIRLGAQGDGVAETADGLRHVPFALPGELWQLADAPDAGNTLLRAAPSRAHPRCPHFGVCGGCVAQHMPDALYAEWKRAKVVEAFRHRGIDAPVEPLVRVPLASRRRVKMHARRVARGLHLGFHRAGSHDIVPIRECPVALPQIVSALPRLEALLEPVLTGKSEAVIDLVVTPAGLDAAIVFTGPRPQSKALARMAAQGVSQGLARLLVNGETLAQSSAPALAFGGVPVELPAAYFVQAVEACETEMVRLVSEATAKAKRVADLFCGLGTFTFPLARRARVLAVDGDKMAIAALEAAARRAQGLKPIETRVRDLFRMPLSAGELAPYDAVVFDPARAGAEAQARELARSKVDEVAAVSCNPGTLARDVRILVDGGYRLDRVTPIDQFLFSHHVEAVATLHR